MYIYIYIILYIIYYGYIYIYICVYIVYHIHNILYIIHTYELNPEPGLERSSIKKFFFQAGPLFHMYMDFFKLWQPWLPLLK